MNTEALPDAYRGTELEVKYEKAQSPEDRQRRGLELLRCYVFTDPERARHLLLELLQSNTSSPAALWRLKGILANHIGAWDEASYAFGEAEHRAGKEGDTSLLFDLVLDRAALAMNRGELRLSEEYLDKALKVLRTPTVSQRFHLAVRQGFLQFYKDQWVSSLAAFMQAERMISTLPSPRDWEDIDYSTLLYGGIGEVYLASGERELARLAFRKALHLCEHYGVRSRMAWHNLCAGNAAMALERWDEAKGFFREAMSDTATHNASIHAGAEANMGYTLLQMQEYAAAADHFDKAEYFYQKAPVDKKNLATISMWKARIAMKEGLKKEVMQHFIQASEYAREVQDNRLLARICREIALYFAEQHDYKNAYDYLLLSDELAMKAREEEQQRRLLELQVQYETEQVEKEADQLRAQALDLRLQVMRAQMNPHFLFNALNGIQNFIHSEDGDKASRYLAKFAGLVRQSLNMSNAELITLEEEVAFIRDYLFVNQKLRFDGRLEFSVEVDEEIDEDRVMVPPMMIQPFVENAIEHGFIKRARGRIDISLDLESEELVRCTILDDGIGREAAIAYRKADPLRQEHQSLGMAITADRIELLNRSGHPGHRIEISDLYTDDGSPCGTKVELWFPVRRKSG